MIVPANASAALTPSTTRNMEMFAALHDPRIPNAIRNAAITAAAPVNSTAAVAARGRALPASWLDIKRIVRRGADHIKRSRLATGTRTPDTLVS
jgi:hypothetical protein